jgi:hypothetical protein
MRGRYTAHHKISALIAAKTLLYLTVPSNKQVTVRDTKVTNGSNETNEQIEVCWQRITTLGTPTATTLTPSKDEIGDQAASSTLKADVTASEPTYGANTEIDRQGVASLAGYRSQKEVVMAGGDSWGLRLLNSPSSFDAIITVVFDERG